jgi:hypothetical protein
MTAWLHNQAIVVKYGKRELGCFQIDERRFQIGDSFKISINGNKGQVVLSCCCGNQGINIANILMQGSQCPADIRILFQNSVGKRVGWYLVEYRVEGSIVLLITSGGNYSGILTIYDSS